MNEPSKNVLKDVIGKLEEIKRDERYGSISTYKTYLETLKEKQEELLEQIQEDIDNLENAIDNLDLMEYQSNKDMYLGFAIDSLEDIVF